MKYREIMLFLRGDGSAQHPGERDVDEDPYYHDLLIVIHQTEIWLKLIVWGNVL